MRSYGWGRYRTGVYPTRSPAFTSMERFTPTFQTPNGDGNLGSTGFGGGAFWITGNVLNVQGVFQFGGAGASGGTGNFLLPLPPGITTSNIDVTRMPLVEDSVGPPHIVEGTVPIHSQGTIAGTPIVFVSDFLLAKNFTDDPPTVAGAAWTPGIDQTTIVSGDVILFDYAIPLL